MKRFDTFHQWIGQLLALDPGHTRLINATKATASLICSILASLLVLFLIGQITIIPIVMAGMIGMMGIIIIMDDTKAKRKVTTLLIGVSAIVGMTIGTLFATATVLINIWMILIIYCSFYFSKYGGRYFSIGQIAFMTIYFSFVTKLSLNQLPAVFLGIAIGILFAYLFNFVFLQDTTQSLKHSMRAFHIQANLTFNILIEGLKKKDINAKWRKRIESHVQKLHGYANIVAGQLNEKDIHRLWPGLTRSQCRSYVFDTGMLIETLVESFYTLNKTDAKNYEELRRILVWVMTTLRDADIHSERHHLEEVELSVKALRNAIEDVTKQHKDTSEWLFLIRRIESIANHILMEGYDIQQALSTGKAIVRSDLPNDNVDAYIPSENIDMSGLSSYSGALLPTTKKAIQALVASVIAIIVGYAIAPIQPYWVLLTVFICLLGTESIGSIYTKGIRRSVGTIIGAAIGFLLAKLLIGETIIELIILFLIVFLSGYTATISYTIMSVFITMTVAFMYNILLGGISFSLIWARIIETIAGALIVYIVSIIILPKKTYEKVVETSDDYLQELKPFIISYIRGLQENIGVKMLTDQAIDIDVQLQRIENEAEPVIKGTTVHRHSEISEWVTTFTAMNYYARQLIASSYRETIMYPKELEETLHQIEQKLGKNIDTLRQLIKNKKQHATMYGLTEERTQIEKHAREQDKTHYDLIHHVYYIWRINQCIMVLGVSLGARKVQ